MNTTNSRKTSMLRSIATEAARHAGRRNKKIVDTFVRLFYANVAVQDLSARTPAMLAAAALSNFDTIAKRRPGKTNIRVHSPDAKRDGWTSPHSFVEVGTDDMPFLVDSASAALAQLGITVALLVHPIMRVKRDGAGNIVEIVEAGSTGGATRAESIVTFEIARQEDAARLKEIADTLTGVYADVRAAVEDWPAMRAEVQGIINDLKLRFAEGTTGEVAEAQDFLQWAHDNHFTFLGYREYEFVGEGKAAKVKVDAKKGLGLLRDSDRLVLSELRHLGSLPSEVQAFVRRPDPVIVSKADAKSTVHRAVTLDTIGVKKFDARGKVIGQRLIVGLFTSTAYSSSPRAIPLLRRKIDKVFTRTGFAPASHDGKALQHILETFPRDELFQIRDADLHDISLGILHTQDHQRVAVFVRLDDFLRYASCFIYVPRERYSYDLRARVQTILEKAFGGEMANYNTEYGETPLARIHMTIALAERRHPDIDIKQIEAEIARAARSWPDNLRRALAAAHEPALARTLADAYGEAFPTSYTDHIDAEATLADVANIHQAVSSNRLTMDLYRPKSAAANELRFKIYHPHVPLPLSDVLPMLEDMGLKVIDEMPHAVTPRTTTHALVMIHDFGLQTRNGAAVDLADVRANFHEVFDRSWSGEMESDGLNALVIGAELGWREIVTLRHFARYLRQVKAPFSQEYMIGALNNNPAIAASLADMFVAKFDPKNKSRDALVEKFRKDILTTLESVTSADEDRVLRRFLNVVDSALRTNFFQMGADGQPKPYLSVKFDSTKIDEMPLPRPLREIFVYSPRVEAIHLRGGLVARGGIRWSDRPEDFRTEILGLMKAQMVKNSVIVPVGSKGGFTVKRPPVDGGRDAIMAEGIACYRTFMSGLLDITDNLKNGKILPPKDVVRLDGDDPYLVVAADKGTATFSDIANGIAIDYGFWLGDAFASGGSVGYDHKKMGITARGAWESVKRHFREVGKDIQNEDFICVGVGDMSGDVFGNGMILSRHTKLIGAFNHMHIFVDPDPDPSTSFKERVRMFNLPRSSWTDYNAKVLSKGGGIYDRKAKSIALSAEARARFAITKATVTPNELIKVMLQAEVELLWFGGIGTYMKASFETHADADDRSNDAVRVSANEVRAKVIGEGANLGVTQRARIEYALRGGRLNADSIDNSAGVDTSDHEVNIKILLDAVVAKKKLSYAQRNVQLAKLTDELALLVLRDNYMQTQAIMLSQAKSVALLDLQQRFVRMLERAGRLDRVIEHLPDDETWAERARDRVGLTRPEIAIVMPYSKMWLYDTLLASDLPDDPLFENDLVNYFPTALRTKYRKEILAHQLRREIIATVVTNSMINRVGGTFGINLMEKTGVTPVEVARAYIVVRDAFNLRAIWSAIEALDAKVHADVQIKLFYDIEQLIERATLWVLRNVAAPIDIGKTIAELKPGISQLTPSIDKLIPKEVTEHIEFRIKRYTDGGVPAPLARQIAFTILMISAPDIVRAAAQSKRPLADVARLYFQIGETFRLGWLRYNAEKLPADNHWQKLAAAAVIEELYAHQKNLALRMMRGSITGDPLERWTKANASSLEQMKQMLTELSAADLVDLSMLAVASRHLSAFSAGE